MLKRWLLLIAGGATLVVALGLAAAYAYYFSGLRTAPRPLALAAPSPTVPSSAGSPASAPAGLVGAWTVASGSQAGYRVKEVFAGQASSHEAVARTSGVSGGLTVSGSAGNLQASATSFVVDLSGLHSVDQFAGFDVSRRDGVVTRSLSIQQYPTATFVATAFALPAGIEAGSQVALRVPGRLTIHGVTKEVTANMQVQLIGDRVQVTGLIPTNMNDFGVATPQVPITVVDPAVTVEFQLALARA